MKRISLLLLFSFVPFLLCSARKGYSIRRVEPVQVNVGVGHVPTLPWQVWVTYSKGRGEWRQVRWDNAARSVEEEEARRPVGASYTIQGYILGDNTTADGFPITAQVRVVGEAEAVPAPKPVGRPLPLGDVQLIGQNRLTANRDLDIRTILSWPVEQQLYNYRDTYGLPTEGYPVADGWDSPTTKLKGHGSGHYMSALAFAFASSQDNATRDQLRQRIRRMVDELRQCQERTFVWSDSLGRYWEARDLAPEAELVTLKGTWTAFDMYKKDWQHYGYGYLNAIPAQHAVLIECYRAYNNEEWVWAPYYSIHKQLAGLIDIALNIDDRAVADKALLIARDMGLWVWNRLHYRTYVKTDGTRDERRQRPGNRYEMWNMYIAGEVGGMAESLSRLSEMVDKGEDKARLLEAASYFDAPAFFDPVSRNIDDIRTRHANQHIPMITGALRSYRGNGNPYYYRLARNFWDLVQGRYAYAMGGVGNGEMFRQPYSQVLDEHVNETCCAYNLAKLTKELNTYTPDDARLMDYYERVLYNQIVGSVHPTNYAVCYQYAVGMNAAKPFGNETPQATCCGGTGAENHVKYQEATYFVSDSTLWIALYMPTVARWREKGITLTQECEWPAERSRITIEGEAEFAMKLRVPYWATEGFDIRLNGKSLNSQSSILNSRYIEIPRRRWTKDDVLEIVMPFQPHVHFHPDKMQYAPRWVGALMLGPLVMATSDVHTWQEAGFDFNRPFQGAILGRDTEGVPTLALQGRMFRPDYWHTGNSTHYLLLDMGKVKKQSQKQQKKAELERLMAVARERVADSVSWTPHGYARMVKAMQAQDAEALKAILNTMRPSNLAEPEDLSELLSLLDEAKAIGNKSDSLRDAIQYAGMVVRYVNDGSGTPDLIKKAMQQLRTAMTR